MSDHALGRRRHVRPISIASYAREVWAGVQMMVRARRTRRYLGELDDRMLADIGIGRGDALMEQSRPMWDVTPGLR